MSVPVLIGWSEDGVVEILINPDSLALTKSKGISEQQVRDALIAAMVPDATLRTILPPGVSEVRFLAADEATFSVARLARAALVAAAEAHSAATSEEW